MQEERWRKSSFSDGAEICIELHPEGAVRDSKNPDGPTIRSDLRHLIAAVKSDRI